MRVRKSGRALFALLLVMAIGAVLSACGSSSEDSSSEESSPAPTSSVEEGGLTEVGYPGVNPANTRNPQSTIDSSNVNDLSVAWKASIPGVGPVGRYSGTPVIDKGVIYSQDLGSNVQALNLDTGKVFWTAKINRPTYGPNGVVAADGTVFGAAPLEAFALDQKTGKRLWTTPITGNKHTEIHMAPSYSEGMVFVATVPVTPPNEYKGGGAGVLWALDAKSGKKLWRFDTVPIGLWGNSEVNSGGGLWYPPAFDDKGGMYFGVANPDPSPGDGKYPWGSSRPGPNLYSNSLVKLDAKTGKLDWYHQVTPHDVYGWDFQGPPILMEADGKEIVVAAGKSGIVLAADPESGKVLWETKVGKHNGHDEDGLLAMHDEESKIETRDDVYPGSAGGVVTPMSTDGRLVFASVGKGPQKIVSGTLRNAVDAKTGEVVALDAATGEIVWEKESDKPTYSTTTVNDVVFAVDAGGMLSAFEAKTGKVLWEKQLAAGTNTGVMIAGDTLVAPTGLAATGQKSEIAAYRLGK